MKKNEVNEQMELTDKKDKKLKKEKKSSKSATNDKSVNLKTLNKSTIWDVQENDVFRMLNALEKDPEGKENLRHFLDIVRSAFLIEELKDDDKDVKQRYTKQDYKVGSIKVSDDAKIILAIKKRPIMRVTDLTYENICHITAAKLIEVLERNFGGGWDSLSQSIQDIIESSFDISTTTLPQERLHKKGGMYEKKVEDGYEVLEIAKGSWVEAIFAKVKPKAEKPRMKFDTLDEENEDGEIIDNYNSSDDDEMEVDDPDDDEINEDNYRTTFTIENNSDEDAESLSDFIADE